MTSLAGIQFELIKNVADWREQYNQLALITYQYKVEVISLTHTARNIGQINIQILWYIPSLNWNTYTCKHLSNHGDYDGLLSEAVHYLNDHVAPHNLVSFSAFEDDHPCPKQQFHVVIYHKGDGIKPLIKPADIQGNIY